VLAVASSDNTATLWDMSLEEDAEAEAALGGGGGGDGGGTRVPPQLLFVHAGQEDLKEVRFHAQLPGVMFSTAASGFNVWKPDVQTIQ
jgi:ribosome assembly protein RRB1